MLLMLDNYKSEYPKREMQTILKFKDCPKQLHEMTLEEINAEVAKWSPLSPKTAFKQRGQISLYLKWLNEKGVSTAINPQDARDIEMPVNEDKEFLIYSTGDIYHYYDLLLKVVEQERVRGVEMPADKAFWMCRAAGILAFYGMTKEQIIALDLSDIQPDGVRGYDLPLTQADIEALLEYKGLEVIGRGAKLLGTKYMRSTKAEEVSEKSLDAILWRTKLPTKQKYLKTMLTISNLYVLGLFNRAYQYEVEHGVRTEPQTKIPQWFRDIFKDFAQNAIISNRKEYIEYRKEREKAAPVPQKKVETGLSKQEKDEINQKLNDLSAQASAIFEEMAKLKQKLK